jgi:DNA-binding response OmpR family regulator
VKRVLVVEDDSAIRRGLTDALRFAGYEVLQAATGTDGMELALQASYELLLLDLILPGCSGFDILERVHQDRPGAPVIILTARGEEADRVKGLRLGADDYVVKPFSVRELLARVEAVLRRSPERAAQAPCLELEGVTVDFARSEARHKNGERNLLSERELELARYFGANPGRVISREEILRHVWRLDARHFETRTIDMHIANLRAKLGDDSANSRVLLTVRGRGYMLALPPTPQPRKTPQ